MESFFSRYKNGLVLLAILLVQVIALATQVDRAPDAAHPDGNHVRLLRLWATAVITPFARASMWTGHSVRGALANYVELRHTRQENESLKRELAQMRLERAGLAEDALAGHRLTTLLGFREHYIASTVAAEVLGTSGTDQSRMLLLDKGANDGLRPGMPVITPDGVVGKLRDVFPKTAQLLLLSDPTAGAGVMLETTRIRAIVHGSAAGGLQITNLTQDDRIKPGEKVLTSGGDQVFPRGLAVGVIETIKPDPQHQPYSIITLKATSNLNRLEEVLVVTGATAAMDAGTQGELAADVGARKLPSVAAPVAEGGTGEVAPPANNSTELVPKPKAALHPDRYSPDAAAPAGALVPGGKKE